MDLELLACFCDEASDLLTKWESICLRLEKSNSRSDFDELFRVAHNLKGSSRAVGLERFGNFVHHVEDGITVFKTGEVKVTKDRILMLLKAQSILSDWITNARTNPGYSPEFESFIQEFQANLAGKVSEAPVAIVPVNATEQVVAKEVVVDDKVGKVEVEKPKTKPTKSSNANLDETVRVSARKLDQILEMVGELSIHQSVIFHSRQIFEGKSDLLSHSVYLSRKLTRELYERALGLRMYPVQPIFQRLERNIKDIAHAIGKQVEVEVHGGEVELDKTVHEKIVEPLTHMVRNSIDHGIEKPETRIQNGKKEFGTVRVSAIQESSSVALVIEDDGQGLNEERILQKALANGVIKPDTKLSQQEIFALIFLPGFSTAEKVTDVSGRGVGMDVVMRAIEDLQGKITIGSEKGKGTKFIITLPTSLSIIDALIVSINDLEYAIPMGAVDEIIDLIDLGVTVADRMFKLRDHILPIQTLNSFLNIQSEKDKNVQKSALITKVGKARVAFRVDRVCGQQQIVVRQLSDGMNNVFGLSGSTILGNGQPGLIVDLPGIAGHYLKKLQAEEAAA